MHLGEQAEVAHSIKIREREAMQRNRSRRCDQQHATDFCNDKDPQWRQNYSNPHCNSHCITVISSQLISDKVIITQLPNLESGRMDIPWAVEQVRRHSLEVVHRDKVHLVAVGQCSLLALVSSPQGQVGWVHILWEQSCIHSQGSAEERHWKLRNTFSKPDIFS